jgi:hypothetical protein
VLPPADSAKLRAAALRGWAFLYTSLNSQFSSRQLESLMASFADLLHDPEVEVRAAAGEGLALLYQASGLADGNYEGFEGWDDDEDDPLDGVDEEGEEDADGDGLAAAVAAASLDQQQQQQQDLSPQGPVANGSSGVLAPLTPGAVAAVTGKAPRRDGDSMSLASCSSVSGLDLVVDRMKDLASNRGDRQRRSKRERSALKGAFRELRGIMEVGAGCGFVFLGDPNQ